MEFKDIIRQLRNERGMNTTQLAGQFEKTEAAIRAWESGRSKPDADTLIKLAQYFDCTADYLLGLSNFKTPAEHNAHARVLGDALDKLDGVLGKLNNSSQEVLANALISAVASLSNPAHAKNNVLTLAGLIEGLGGVYETALTFADKKTESALFKFLSKHYNFEGFVHQISVAEVVFDEVFGRLVESDIYEAERIYNLLSEHFSAPRSLKYEDFEERVEQRKTKDDAVSG
jgi:transcriptional regulator with XRE-family HTH domain